MCPDCSETFLGLQGCTERGKEVRVGLRGRATDSTPELVELREAHRISALYDQGVSCGHVEAALDNRRGDQNVDLPVEKAPHHILQSPLGHLPMRYREPYVGHERTQLFCGLVYALDPVMDEKDLSSSMDLLLNSPGHEILIVRTNVG